MSTIDEKTETTPDVENASEDNRPATPPFALELTEEKRAEVLDYLLGELNEAISARSERMKKMD